MSIIKILVPTLLTLTTVFVACKHTSGSDTESSHVTDGPSMTAPDRDNANFAAPAAPAPATPAAPAASAKQKFCVPVLTLGSDNSGIALVDTANGAGTSAAPSILSCDSPAAQASFCPDGSLRDFTGNCPAVIQ